MGIWRRDEGGAGGRLGLWGTVLGLGVTLLLLLSLWLRFAPLMGVEDRLYDLQMRLRGPISPSSAVVVAAIDEKSLKSVGHWPWPRRTLAELTTKLADAGAALIVYDVILSEPAPGDRVLAKAVDAAGNVLMPTVFLFADEKGAGAGPADPPGALSAVRHPGRLAVDPPPVALGAIVPVPPLQRAEAAQGQINILPDDDGTLRWETAIVAYRRRLYLSLDLTATAAFLGVPHDRIVLDSGRGIALGPRYFPTDRWGRLLIPYAGPEHTIPYLSVADLLDGRVAPAAVRGKIVVVGATASGLHDTVVTPFSPYMAGVEKHAQLISALLEGRSIRRASPWVNGGLLLAVGLLFSLLLPRLRALAGAAAGGLGLLGLLLPGYFLLARDGLWLDLAHPALAIGGIFLAVTVCNFAVEERYARRVRAIFSSYVTERVVRELIRRPELARVGGERREVTLLFADVRGFTSFAERHPPEAVVALLNELLAAMTEVIFRWEGTLDKFIGDAIFAFWGAPLRQEDHAERALRCALDMERRLLELQQEWEARGVAPLDIGIGLNSGEVLVGNIGAEGKKMDYTVIGDAVNIGARVEALTRRYNCRILVTETTLTRIREELLSGRIGHVAVIKSLAEVTVKGRTAPVALYQVGSIEHGRPSQLPELPTPAEPA